MTPHSMAFQTVSHGSFTIQRRHKVALERLWGAWTDPAQIRQWAAPWTGWTFDIVEWQFYLGGTSLCRFGPAGEVPFTDSGRFDDIVLHHRIVTAYAISKGALRISSSVASVEFIADASGTLLRTTESGAFLDGQDRAQGRKGGMRQQMSQLNRFHLLA